jgi:hypothetical protein
MWRAVVQYGAAVPDRTTPAPISSPQGGGGEIVTANRIFSACGLGAGRAVSQPQRPP